MTISGSLANIIQQVFVPKVDYFRTQISGVWTKIQNSARKPTPDNIGQNWTVIWPFRLGLAGSVDFASIAGPDMASVSAPGFQVYSGVETWSGLSENPVPAYVQRTLTLKKAKVNMMIPTQLMRAAQLKASIGDAVEFTIDGVAMNVALTMANAFLGAQSASGGYNGRLGSFTSGTSESISGSGLTVTLAAPGSSGVAGTAFQRFQPGQRVDIFLNSGGSTVRVNTNGPVYVDVPEPFGTAASPTTTEGSIKLYTADGSTYSLSNTTLYDIVLRNSGREAASNNVPTCLDSVLQATGGSVFGVSVTNYPILASMLRDLNGSALSEIILLKYLAHYQRARGALHPIDSLIGTEGIWANFFQDMLTLGANTNTRIERNGAKLNYQGGISSDETPNIGLSYQLYGRNYNFLADPCMAAQTLVGHRLEGGNWQIVRPPRIPGTRSNSQFPGELEFLAPLFGGNGIFLPLLQVGGGNAGAITNFMQAPAEMPYEILPESIPGLRISRVGEFYG